MAIPFKSTLDFTTLFKNFNKKDDLFLNWTISGRKNYKLYSKSSIAILAVAIKRFQTIGIKPTIWFPAFICKEALSALKGCAYNIKFYDVFSHLDYVAPSKKLSLAKDNLDIVVYVHYFGNTSCYGLQNWSQYCKDKNILLIEDAAHCPFPIYDIGKFGDYTYFSLHKHFPISNGSILISKDNREIPSADDILKLVKNNKNLRKKPSLLIQILWLLKEVLRKYTGSILYKFRLNQKIKTIDKDIEYPHISIISVFLLKSVNKSKFFFYKNKNFNHWIFFIDHLCKKLDLNVLVPKNRDNSMLPLVTYENKAISKKIADNLIKIGIPVTSWPEYPSEILESYSSEIINKCYYIPCNPSIAISDVFKLIPKNINFDDINIDQILPPNMFEQPLPIVQTKKYLDARFINKRDLIKKYNLNSTNLRYRKRNLILANLYTSNFTPILQKTYNISDSINFLRKFYDDVTLKKINSFFIISPYLLNCGLTDYILFKSGFIRIPFFKNWQSSKIFLEGQSLEEIRINFDSKWRNQLKKSESANLTIKISEDINIINKIYENSFKYLTKLKIKSIPKSIFYKLHNHKIKSDLGLISIVAENDNKIISGIILAYTDLEMTYFIGWSSEEGRKNYSNQLLLWKALILSKKMNKKYFDTGGIDTESSKGVANFKKGMNGILFELIGTYIYLPRPLRLVLRIFYKF